MKIENMKKFIGCFFLLSAVLCTLGEIKFKKDSPEHEVKPKLLNYESKDLRTSRSYNSCNCGWTNQGRLVGGQETRRHQFPWIVGISNVFGDVFCAGSIITQHHIITAAHCFVNNPNPFKLIIVTGSHWRNEGESGISVSSIHMHPHHRDNPLTRETNDIAILVTRQAISFNQYVSPICMPKEKIYLNFKTVKAIGWGIDDNLSMSPVLKHVDLTVIPYAACRLWDIMMSLNEKQICTLNPGKSTCYGDSGGPLVYLDPMSGRYTLVGVISYGEDCKTPPPAVFTEVASYLHWIYHIIIETKTEVTLCTLDWKLHYMEK